MISTYKRPFTHYVKKARKPLQMAIEDAVAEVCANSGIGDSKTGDLAGIRVYKFKFQRQEYFIAYRSSVTTQTEQTIPEDTLIDFYQVGPHGNFYDELKRYLRGEGRS